MERIVDLSKKIADFYALDVLHSMVSRADTTRPSIEALLSDVSKRKASLDKWLADLLYRHTLLISSKEALYIAVPDCAHVDVYDRDALFFAAVSKGSWAKNRAEGLDGLMKIREDHLRKFIKFAFLDGHIEWPSDFGGSRWANIAEVVLSYYNRTPSQFVDSIVHLHHNTGSIFKKSTPIIYHTSLMNTDYIDRVVQMKFEDDILKYDIFSSETTALIRRAVNLGVIEDTALQERPRWASSFDVRVSDRKFGKAPLYLEPKGSKKFLEYAIRLMASGAFRFTVETVRLLPEEIEKLREFMSKRKNWLRNYMVYVPLILEGRVDEITAAVTLEKSVITDFSTLDPEKEYTAVWYYNINENAHEVPITILEKTNIVLTILNFSFLKEVI